MENEERFNDSTIAFNKPVVKSVSIMNYECRTENISTHSNIPMDIFNVCNNMAAIMSCG